MLEEAIVNKALGRCCDAEEDEAILKFTNRGVPRPMPSPK